VSLLVEIVISNLGAIENLIEETTSWGGRLESYDPPRYRFGSIVCVLASVPKHISTRLPDVLRSVKQCIRIPEAVVLGWRYGSWSDAEQESIEDLCSTLSACRTAWAVVVDTSNGSEITIAPDTRDVCEQIASALRAATGLTLVVHASGQ
jgi:hypothetical protein